MRVIGKILLCISLGLVAFNCGGTNTKDNNLVSSENEQSQLETEPETASSEPSSASVPKPSQAYESTQVPEAEQTPTPQQTPTPVEAPLANELLTQLDMLTIEPESAIAPYDRAKFPHWDDEDGDGMNTRLEVLEREKISGVGWYSRWDGIWYEGEGGLSAPSFDIDHIVSLSEAWDSGASEWGSYDRDIFADDVLNLVAVSASSNRSKGGRDVGEWLPSDPDGQCFLSIRVIQVKSKWDLSVDQVEYETLRNLIEVCGSNIPQIPTPPEASATPIPSTPTPADPTPTPISAAPTPSTPTPTPQSSYGSSYYVTANGVDIDQYDANGNGDINCGELPSAAKPVTVSNPAEDPYGLDGDGDGIGCES